MVLRPVMMIHSGIRHSRSPVLVDIDGARRLTFVLSDTLNDPSNSIVHIEEPLGEAVFGSATGDKIEMRIGSKIRTVIVEEIIKDPTISVH